MTVKEIAELAGVSIGTVDRVLHGRGRVSAETKERIEGIIKRSGFTPNPMARRLKRNRPYRFFALLPHRDEDSGYWGQGRAGILAAAEEVGPLGAEVTVLEFDRYSGASFRSAAARILESEPDGVILAPIMPEESRAFVGSLTVPYVFFDADLPGTSPLSAIGQDSLRGGYLAGRLVHLFAGGGAASGCFAVLVAHQEDYHIGRRRDGFLRYAAQAPFQALAVEGVDLEHDGAAAAALADLLDRRPDCRGVFVAGASSHRIAEAARDLRSRRSFIIVGYDLVEANRRLLAEGAMDAVISQRPETQGRRAVLDLYRAVAVGRPVAARVEVPLDVYIRENVPPAADAGSIETGKDSGAWR